MKATRPGLGPVYDRSATGRGSLERMRHEQIWGIWLSSGEGSKQTAGTERKLLRVVRRLAGRQTKIPTSALSFLLLFLPVNWTFPHSTTVFLRGNGSQWLKDHHFNSVTQDFSRALPGLNYQERHFKEEISYSLHLRQESSRCFMGKDNSSLQVYLRTDAIQSCHKMRTRKRCLRAE